MLIVRNIIFLNNSVVEYLLFYCAHSCSLTIIKDICCTELNKIKLKNYGTQFSLPSSCL